MELLFNNPRELLIKYQFIIEIVVSKYVRYGYFKPDEKNDVIQTTFLKLLDKIPSIQRNYKDKFMLKTYLSTIITNLVREYIRQNKYIPNTEVQDYHLQSADNYLLEEIYVKEHIDRLHKIFILYGKEKHKLILLLKIVYRIPIKQTDIYRYYHKADSRDVDELISKLENHSQINDKELFSIITPFLNSYEGKNNSTEAIRKWIKRKINEVIELMNGSPPIHNYDSETLQILVEKIFKEKFDYESRD
jgi:hypothetical protein